MAAARQAWRSASSSPWRPRRSRGPDDLEDAAHEANFAVHRAYGGEGGATLTAAVFTPGEAFLVHSGDSRLYVHAPDGAFALLTRDDTPSGLLAGDDLESDMSSQLTQFVGIGAGFTPRVSAIARPAEATWMLTTDGAHMIGRGNLRRLLETSSDAEEATRRLIEAAEEAGAWDNATALVVRPDHFWRDLPAADGVALTAWTPSGEAVLR